MSTFDETGADLRAAKPLDISAMVEVPPPAHFAVQSPIDAAVQLLKQGVAVEQLQAMMTLQFQWEANEARKAFVRDMSAWKEKPPTILKDTLVDFTNKAGQRTSYKHATLGSVCDAIVQSLGSFGFSHRWDVKQSDRIEVTCIITHRQGHSEQTTMRGPLDESGSKNPLQSIGSTVTYLSRYSLLAAVGLATNDTRDDDGGSNGRGAYQPEERFRLTEWLESAAEARDLNELADIKKRGDAVIRAREDVAAFEAFKKAVQARRRELDPEYEAKLAAARKPAEREPGED